MMFPNPLQKSFRSLLTMALVGSATAAEFVLEPFDGPAGQAINGTGSGTGWADAWVGANSALFGPGNAFIATGENSAGLAESSAASCALSGGADLTRLLDRIYTIGDDTAGGELSEIYLSFLVENPGPIAIGHEFRTSLLNGGSEVVSFGKRINRNWTLLGGGEELSLTANGGNDNLGTWFAVVKLAYNGSDTIATGYLAEAGDPDLDLTDPSTYLRTATVTLPGKAVFDGVRINSHNTSSARIDEIRIGDDLANVTATPDPLLVVDTTLTFEITNTATTLELPLSNAGNTRDLVITTITPGGPNGDLLENASSLPVTLPTGEEGNLALAFTPEGPGTYNAQVTLVSNDAATPSRVVELIINVRDPLISVAASTLDFGSLATNPGPQTLTLTVNNVGSSEDLVISALSLTGAPQFASGTLPPAIPAGESAEIEVTFAPEGADGFFAGSLAIESNDFNLRIPEVSLSAFVAPSNPVVALYDFDPNELFDTTLDLDGSERTAWTTGNLIDAGTGVGALGAGNQTEANRYLAVGRTGNYLRFSSNRESDEQTPVQEGGSNESTWSTFAISPGADGPLGFNGGEAVVQTYAINGIAGNNQTDWTLYFSLDEGTTWTSLGTFAGAGIDGVGESGPVEIRWDLTPIGTQNRSVAFILDPVAIGANNGSAAQRGLGFDNLYVTLGVASELAITDIVVESPGRVSLTWSGAPGNYAIDYSFDLEEGSWLELTDTARIAAGSTSGNATLELVPAEANASQVFYRVRSAP